MPKFSFIIFFLFSLFRRFAFSFLQVVGKNNHHDHLRHWNLTNTFFFLILCFLVIYFIKLIHKPPMISNVFYFCCFFQCTNGHLMCAGCFTHLLADARIRDETATCPNCRCVISKDACSRNLAVEKAVCELPGECRFCSQELPRSLLEKHMADICEERIVSCKYAPIGCGWNGPHHEAGMSSHIFSLRFICTTCFNWFLFWLCLTRVSRRIVPTPREIWQDSAFVFAVARKNRQGR